MQLYFQEYIHKYIYIIEPKERKEDLFFLLSSPVMRNSERKTKQEKNHAHTQNNFRASVNRYCYNSKTILFSDISLVLAGISDDRINFME